MVKDGAKTRMLVTHFLNKCIDFLDEMFFFFPPVLVDNYHLSHKAGKFLLCINRAREKKYTVKDRD